MGCKNSGVFMKPIIKYVGGKTWLAPSLSSIIKKLTNLIHMVKPFLEVVVLFLVLLMN